MSIRLFGIHISKAPPEWVCVPSVKLDLGFTFTGPWLSAKTTGSGGGGDAIGGVDQTQAASTSGLMCDAFSGM